MSEQQQAQPLELIIDASGIEAMLRPICNAVLFKPEAIPEHLRDFVEGLGRGLLEDDCLAITFPTPCTGSGPIFVSVAGRLKELAAAVGALESE